MRDIGRAGVNVAVRVISAGTDCHRWPARINGQSLGGERREGVLRNEAKSKFNGLASTTSSSAPREARTSTSTAWSRSVRLAMPKRMPPTRAAGSSSPRSAAGASPSRSPEGLTSGRSARSPGPSMARALGAPRSRGAPGTLSGDDPRTDRAPAIVTAGGIQLIIERAPYRGRYWVTALLALILFEYLPLLSRQRHWRPQSTSRSSGTIPKQGQSTTTSPFPPGRWRIRHSTSDRSPLGISRGCLRRWRGIVLRSCGSPTRETISNCARSMGSGSW
jgi:hypothetical protein